MRFNAAGALAEFSNLTVADVEEFRANNPDFAPFAWWRYQPDPTEFGSLGTQWEYTQKRVQAAWEVWGTGDDSELSSLIQLYTLVFNPDDTWDGTFKTGKKPLYPGLGFGLDKFQYHKAIEFISAEPWRAKVCLLCHRRYAANHPKRDYCSVTCSSKVAERTHVEWGRKNNWGRPKPTKKRRK